MEHETDLGEEKLAKLARPEDIVRAQTCRSCTGTLSPCVTCGSKRDTCGACGGCGVCETRVRDSTYRRSAARIERLKIRATHFDERRKRRRSHVRTQRVGPDGNKPASSCKGCIAAGKEKGIYAGGA